IGGLGTTNDINKNLRQSQISWLQPSEETNWIYEILEPVVLSINSEYFHYNHLSHIQNLQLTEYDSSYEGHYHSHVDNWYGDMNDLSKRCLSLSMSLIPSDQYEGGELILYPFDLRQQITADKTPGTITVFRSHIIHEVKPVTKGTRYSLVTWVAGS
ncbi:MAG TPA: 2OG-Fe(II) oxygenase, partial [Methylomirabilota bacterium]|nr:2OG-Fe(II) oxygenase [Methylomirabilota bacterium]